MHTLRGAAEPIQSRADMRELRPRRGGHSGWRGVAQPTCQRTGRRYRRCLARLACIDRPQPGRDGAAAGDDAAESQPDRERSADDVVRAAAASRVACSASLRRISGCPRAGHGPSWTPLLRSTRPGGVRSAGGSTSTDPSWRGLRSGCTRRNTGCRSTPLIAGPGWIPDEPVELRSLRLTLDEQPHARCHRWVRGGDVCRRVRCAQPGQWFDSYTSAIRHLDPPRLFESRPSYRLLGEQLGTAQSPLRFSGVLRQDRCVRGTRPRAGHRLPPPGERASRLGRSAARCAAVPDCDR